MNATDKAPPREFTLFYSGLSGCGHIHSSKNHKVNGDDEYIDLIEKSAYNKLQSRLEKCEGLLEKSQDLIDHAKVAAMSDHDANVCLVEINQYFAEVER